ncbi:DUF58 domain-containing protein [Rubrivivax benzoatilyticus]|uniref:DUF58 domain-containing protein n=1 Tax=Rubrivivax benzoatilyticus TaxID=316997 RepID=UPI0002FDFDF3|nr:DUF58 domain-containing protein [Rubrivivax benzoatilyticus]
MPESAEHLLRRLEWTVLRRLDGVLQGDWRTLLRGAGVDLADLREYQLFDDVRHIDWNVTARLQQPYVRQFVEDRDLSAWFLLDLSPSVDFGSGGCSKREVAQGFVGALARVFTRHGNRVGAVLYGRKVEHVLPPSATRRHVLELLRRMQAPATPAPGSTPTSLAELLDTAGGILRRRSMVFVVSDFISTPGWGPALGRLARRHEVVAVRVLDPAEMALPDVGLVTVEDAETGEQLLVDAADPEFRARHDALAAEQEERLRAALFESGADVLELATDEDLLDALLRFADLRRQRARLKASPRLPAHLRERAEPLGAGA